MTVAQEIIDRCQASMGALLDHRVDLTPDKEAFRYPDVDETWQSLTWRETRDRVHQYAAGLLSLGLGHEERVALASSTRIEWILVDLAVNCAAGATTAIYPNTTGDDFAHIITHSESRIFVAENAEQLAKLRANSELAAQVRSVVLIDGDDDADDVITLAELRERGVAHLAERPDAVRDTIASTDHDTLATLIYTSGTTGLPKGVRLTHLNWLYQGEAVADLDILYPEDVQYLWLPLAHVFGRDLIAIQVAIGFATAVDGRLDRIVPGLGAVHPTFMCGAPRIFEKVRAAVIDANSSGIKAKIARWAFSVGLKSNPYRLAGRPMPALLAAQYKVADRLVFSKLQARMGGNIRFFISGSAKLSSQVQQWFYAAGILICEGYGLTETSAVAFVNHPRTPRFGTVGPVLPGTETRLGDDGEVWVRGPGITRAYHNDPERTDEVFDGDWFATGDIGVLDDDGYLTLTDRKKDLMKTSGGKYVAPQRVEGAIAANVKFVSQAVAIGDGRKYVSALITIDPAAAERWAARHGLAGRSYDDLVRSPELRATAEHYMERANKRLERWEQVKKFEILDREFTVEDGVTPNQKLRRSLITRNHADLVDSMYPEED